MTNDHERADESNVQGEYNSVQGGEKKPNQWPQCRCLHEMVCFRIKRRILILRMENAEHTIVCSIPTDQIFRRSKRRRAVLVLLRKFAECARVLHKICKPTGVCLGNPPRRHKCRLDAHLMQKLADMMQTWSRLSYKSASGTLFGCHTPSMRKMDNADFMQTLSIHYVDYHTRVQLARISIVFRLQ
jgi:hypothetical protein